MFKNIGHRLPTCDTILCVYALLMDVSTVGPDITAHLDLQKDDFQNIKDFENFININYFT